MPARQLGKAERSTALRTYHIPYLQPAKKNLRAAGTRCSIALQDAAGDRYQIQMLPIKTTPRSISNSMQAILAAGYPLLAVSPHLRQALATRPPLRIADGRRLFLALLPQLLDQKEPGWQKRPLRMAVNDVFSGCALLRLAEESSQIVPEGNYAASLNRVLYQKHGCIPLAPAGAPDIQPFQLYMQWQSLCFGDLLLPPACAEAILTYREQPARLTRSYLQQLAKRAQKNHIRLV